jgi:predicted acylesterase/phospholipase RssA
MGEDQSALGLVLQGGGALGSYELGAARRLYAGGFRPDVISGVSIGAISAVLLGRPRNGDAIGTLDEFWRRVSLPNWLSLFDPMHVASLFGVPHFYAPLPTATSLYSVERLRATLSELVDVERLGQRGAAPRVIVSATNLDRGAIDYFDSGKQGLTLDHVLASGALPPSFPMVQVAAPDGVMCSYWDGGVFDNTPLGPVIDAVGEREGEAPRIVVVNLFENIAPVPRSMTEVSSRFLDLIFANKTRGDVALMGRFNRLVALAERVPAGAAESAEVVDLLKEIRGYRNIQVIEIMPEGGVLDADRSGGSGDFSAGGIEHRAELGWRQTDRCLGGAGVWPVRAA